MSNPFIGEIIMFGGNFAPRNYAECNGALLSISSNDALFALLGTVYGGDGRNTFALPDLRGRLPLHQGQSAGTSHRLLGQSIGQESITLLPDHLPPHKHNVEASQDDGDANAGSNKVLAQDPSGTPVYTTTSTALLTMSQAQTSMSGNGAPHKNMMPFLSINFVIALMGVFPPRN